MKQFANVASGLLAATVLTACGNGASTPVVGLPQQSVPSARVKHLSSPCGTKKCIYVASRSGNIITVYPLNANGNVAPAQSISGSYTGLNTPVSVAFDKSGDMYVTNLTGPSVTVYAAGTFGNVAPIRTIQGSNTGFGVNGPAGITLDSKGRIYVSDDSSNSVRVFAAGANGNVAPIRVLSGSYTQLNGPEEIRFNGTNMMVANYYPNNGETAITIYPRSAKGNVPPTSTISGSYTGLASPQEAIIAKSTGQVYVANTGDNYICCPNVEIFAAGASGNVAPIALISGSYSGITEATGIALDSKGNMYVGNGRYDNNVLVFAAGANGNVAPIRSIGGPNTQLNFVQDVEIH